MENEGGSAVVKTARSRMLLDPARVIFGAGALRLPMIEDPDIGTFCTDGKCIRYNPEFAEKIGQAKTQTVIAHEVIHVQLNHHLRRGGRDPREWNIAADFAANGLMVQCGEWDFPDGVLIDPAYNGLSAEQIHEILFPPKSKGDPGGDPGDPDGDPKGDPGGDPKGDPKGDPGDPSDPKGDPGGELGEKIPSQDWGGVEDQTNENGDPLSAAERSEAESENRIVQVQTVQSAKSMNGEISEGIERVIKDLFKPRKNWREILRRFALASSPTDQTWSRPNRRFLGSGLYLPKNETESMGELVVVNDMSGSIFGARKAFGLFGAEFAGIVREVQPEKVTVLYCSDRLIGEPDVFRRGDPVVFKVRGHGGGTDFRPPFQWIRENGSPQAIIYFTDLECGFYPTDPGVPVLWACWESERQIKRTLDHYGSPPFGEIVSIQD